MIVRATRMGYYQGRKREGVVFILQDEKHFSSKWMEKVDPDAPVKKEAPNFKRGHRSSSGDKDVI